MTLANTYLNDNDTSDSWLRVSLAPHIELLERPAQTPEREEQIATLVADASRLLNDETLPNIRNYQPSNINWIGSLDLL
jgi:hypothetical protein